MVVSCIANTDQMPHLQCRLVAASFERFYEEKISSNEILLAIRTNSLTEAEHLGGLLDRAGALQIHIDPDAI